MLKHIRAYKQCTYPYTVGKHTIVALVQVDLYMKY